jgi:hypothetical protein
MGFWLERALNEGNLSNLLAFFRNKLREEDVPPGTVDRFVGMQVRVKDALRTAEEQLRTTPAPGLSLVYQWVLDLVDALDEEVFAEALGYLFPKSAVATTALKVRVATQLRDLALHVLNRTKEENLRQKAVSLLDWSQRLMPHDRVAK